MPTTSKTKTTTTPTSAAAPVHGSTPGVPAVPGLGGLALSRRLLLRTIDALPQDKLVHQPVAGANHALWIMGHIAGSEDYFRSAVGGFERAVDQAWIERFGKGSKPVADVKAYPPVAEIRRMLEVTRANLLAWFGSLGADDWKKPLPKELQGFAPTIGDMPGAMDAHEGFHVGQMSVIKRSLGIEPAM